MVKIKNRRRGPDLFIQWINYLSIISWIIIIIIFFLVSLSKPDYVFNPKSGLNVGSTWDMELLEYSLYLMFPLFILSIVGLTINAARHKRKSDSYNKTLIFNLIVCIICIIFVFSIKR